MSGFDNEVMYGIGIDLSGNTVVTNKLDTDGFLYIGNSASNPVAALPTSSDSSITWTGGNGSLDAIVDTSGLPTVATTYVTDSGNATPSANILNVLGIEETETRGSGNTLSIFSPRVSEFIVDPVADVGTHTTIASALSAASSGDSIFIRPGTYTEDLTIPNGVNVYGSVNGMTPSIVRIEGKLTFTDAITSSFSNLRFFSNGDVILDIGGSGANQTQFRNCVFGFSDSSCMTINNTLGSPNFWNCSFTQDAVSLKLIDGVACGSPTFDYCRLTTSSTPGVSNIDSGNLFMRYSSFSGQRFVTSGTAFFNISFCSFENEASNTVPLTTAGTSGSYLISNVRIRSGTAAAISVGAGTTVALDNASIDSTNANPVTGAGTIDYGPIFFSNSGDTVNTTSTTARNLVAGGIAFDGGTDFLSNYEEGTFTPEMTGAGGAPTITYTSQLGRYTRVGNLVTARIAITINTISGGSSSAHFTGLPYASLNASGESAMGSVLLSGVGFAAGASLAIIMDPNVSYFRISESITNTAQGSVAITDFAAGDLIRAQVTYMV